MQGVKGTGGHNECQRRYRKIHSKRIQTRMKEWLKDNPGKRTQYARTYRVKSYGITQADYDRMLAEQGGVCAICKNPETKIYQGTPASLSIDHDHETTVVRGLLCIKCNRSLHDIAWHHAALEYLKRFE